MHPEWHCELRDLQVWTLYLRQHWRAVLPIEHLPDRHRLRDLRLGLRNDQHRHHHHVNLPSLRQNGWPVLQQQQLHGCRRSMHLFKHDRQILVPGLRRRQPALLLELDDQHDRVQRRRYCL